MNYKHGPHVSKSCVSMLRLKNEQILRLDLHQQQEGKILRKYELNKRFSKSLRKLFKKSRFSVYVNAKFRKYFSEFIFFLVKLKITQFEVPHKQFMGNLQKLLKFSETFKNYRTFLANNINTKTHIYTMYIFL